MDTLLFKLVYALLICTFTVRSEIAQHPLPLQKLLKTQNMATDNASSVEDEPSTTVGNLPGTNATGYELHYSDEDCVRHPKHISLGQGALGDSVYVNVGYCYSKREIVLNESVSSFPDVAEDKTKVFNQLRRSYTEGKDSRCSNSNGIHSCAASKIRVERYSTFQGIKEVEVIDKCSCQARAAGCQRHPYYVTHFPDSPFEKTVDVGACHGRCQGKGHRDRSMSCRAVHNRSLAIPGPNGDVLVNVIENCECTESCYRVSHFEQIYDYTSSLENGTAVPVRKIIDVGQCVGGCGGHRHSKCVQKKTIYPPPTPPSPVYDADDDDDDDYNYYERRTTTTTTPQPTTTRVECTMHLLSRPSRCLPRSVQPHRYQNRYGEDRLLLAITSCACQ